MSSFSIHDQLEFYVAGALTSQELNAFVVHLDQCELCSDRLPILMDAAAALIPDSPPPVHLWDSIARSIGV